MPRLHFEELERLKLQLEIFAIYFKYIVDPCGKQFKAQFAGLIHYLYTLNRSDRSERKKKNKTQTQQKLVLVLANSFFASNVVGVRETERER